MSDLFSIFDRLINNAQQNFAHTKQNFNRWRYCVALSVSGWKIGEYKKLEGIENDDIMVRWEKEGEKDIEIRLSFAEQYLWLEYIKSGGKNG